VVRDSENDDELKYAAVKWSTGQSKVKTSILQALRKSKVLDRYRLCGDYVVK